MNAHRLAATLRENGTLMLEGLPFHAGETVEVIILEQPGIVSSFRSVGSQEVEFVELPPDQDYLSAVAETMTEWDSEADEIAYQNL